MHERRTAPRLLCAELVEVDWEEAGRQIRRVANLEDISLTGVRLHMEKPIPSGSTVMMHYGHGVLIGIVRYCEFREFGYFLGVQLQDGSPWSSEHFRPSHLVDPRDLVEQAVARHYAAANGAVEDSAS